MNIVIYNKDTNNILVAGELQSDIKVLSEKVIVSGITLRGIDWSTTCYDCTEDSFPEGFIDTSGSIGQSYTLTYDNLNITSCKGNILLSSVKAEAGRRICAIAPEWKQRNLLATSLSLVEKGVENLTTEEQAALDETKAMWATLNAIREASDLVEAELLSDPDYDFINSPLWP